AYRSRHGVHPMTDAVLETTPMEAKPADAKPAEAPQKTPEAVLEATDVVKGLGAGAGEVRALKGVSLSLAPGELTLLMGPSGSGKTTLLSVLGCMLSPTSGTVQIRGRSTSGLDSEELAAL